MDYKIIRETSKCDSFSENQKPQLSAAHNVAFHQASVLKWQIGPSYKRKQWWSRMTENLQTIHYMSPDYKCAGNTLITPKINSKVMEIFIAVFMLVDS